MKQAQKNVAGNLICGNKQGTITGYSRHREARDLPACDPCKKAQAEHSLKKRAGESSPAREYRLRKNREGMNNYLSDSIRAEANRKRQANRKDTTYRAEENRRRREARSNPDVRAKENARKRELRDNRRTEVAIGSPPACGDKQGTTTGYSRHQEAGDLPACPSCAAANSQRIAKRRAEKQKSL